MQSQNDDEIFFTLQEAADYSHVTKQAVYIALRKGKIKADKDGRKWKISKADLNAYRANKYNRDERIYNGEMVFDMEKGHFSVHQVSKVISSTLGHAYPPQKIYYFIRTGRLKAFRKGPAWVIAKEDAIGLLEREQRKNIKQMEMI